MATVTAKLRTAYKGKSSEFPIVICVRNGDDTRLIPTGCKVDKDFFKDGKVIKKHPDHHHINAIIANRIQEATDYLADCQRSGRKVNLKHIGVLKAQNSFLDYVRRREQDYRAKGMVHMWLKAERMIKELQECFGGDIAFQDLTQDALRQYEQYLIGKGNIDNTRFKKFEHLRKFYTGGLNEGLVEGVNPFKLYKISTTPVKKEKLTVEEFTALEAVPLRDGPTAIARDLFLFSYYCKGARFETCITMPKEALQGGRLHFQSNKGKKFLSVLLHPKLKAIVDRYKDNPTPYLLPIISEDLPGDPLAYKQLMDKSNVKVNRRLEVAAGLAGIQKKVTIHIARHTFAYHLKKVSGNIGVIQDALGHSSATMTERYLRELDDEAIDGELRKLYGS